MIYKAYTSQFLQDFFQQQYEKSFGIFGVMLDSDGVMWQLCEKFYTKLPPGLPLIVSWPCASTHDAAMGKKTNGERRYSPLYQRAMELNKRDNFKMRL